MLRLTQYPKLTSLTHLILILILFSIWFICKWWIWFLTTRKFSSVSAFWDTFKLDRNLWVNNRHQIENNTQQISANAQMSLSTLECCLTCSLNDAGCLRLTLTHPTINALTWTTVNDSVVKMANYRHWNLSFTPSSKI